MKKLVNHSVISSYELVLNYETNTAELRRYNRPVTANDEGTIFVQKISAERYYHLLTWFGGVSYFRANKREEWYTCGVTFPGYQNSARTGRLFRL